jgi:hypothetical protein
VLARALNLKANGLTDRVNVTNVGVIGSKRKIVVPVGYSDCRYSIYGSIQNRNSTFVDLIKYDDIIEDNDI